MSIGWKKKRRKGEILMRKIILLTTTTGNRGTTRKLAYVVKTADSKHNKEDIDQLTLKLPFFLADLLTSVRRYSCMIQFVFEPLGAFPA